MICTVEGQEFICPICLDSCLWFSLNAWSVIHSSDEQSIETLEDTFSYLVQPICHILLKLHPDSLICIWFIFQKNTQFWFRETKWQLNISISWCFVPAVSILTCQAWCPHLTMVEMSNNHSFTLVCDRNGSSLPMVVFQQVANGAMHLLSSIKTLHCFIQPKKT